MGSKKQSTIPISSYESEYVAASKVSIKEKFLRTILAELTDKNICIKLFNDNQSAYLWTNDRMPHNRTKHIQI